MSLLNSVSLLLAPLAATADEIKPWMIAAIAGGALLVLLLLIFAARKSRSKKHGDEIREAMSGPRQDMQNTGEIWKDFEPINPENTGAAAGSAVAGAPASAQAAPSQAKPAGKTGRGKHAK